MASSGNDNSFDLLGLGGSPAAEQPAPAASQASPAAAVAAYPPAWKNSAELIAYPPAVEPDAGGAGAGPAPLLGDESPPSAGRAAPAASAVAPPPPSDPSHRHFIVRCEGRWRVRSAPSLSSKVIGTVANGTVVIAREEPGDAAGSVARAPDDSRGAESMLAGRQEGHTIGTLWVQVVRFEAQEPMGVSEIKRDTASGGDLYCLRRNALGYGLYEVGLEPLDGPLITLPEKLSSELRSDAQRAAADKAEDVSLTWKLLGAAESVGRFFTSMSGSDEGGINEDMKPQVRRRPEEVFEVRQREQLKKSAGNLKKATQKVIAKAGSSRQDNLFAGLTKDVARRFARLRSSLAETTRSAPLVTPPQASTAPAAASAASPSSPPEVASAGQGQAVEGSVAELERFVELLSRLERTGGWPELDSDLRQEVINFSNKHAADVEHHAISLGKAAQMAERLGSADGLGPPSPAQKPSSPAQRPLGGGGGILPLLPPPPPPSSGVGTGRLI